MQRERKFRNKENKQEGKQNQIKSDMVKKKKKKKKKSIKMDILKRREGRSLRVFFVVIGIETRD